MSFDLSSVLSQAQQVSTQNQGGGNNPRLIYPGTGTLKVKLLYNPKSNSVSRLIRRHKVGNTNYVCLNTYGGECPICKILDSIKNSTGADPWKYNAKARGISYAQYVGSDGYRWDDDNKEPQVGELILLMYPWTVYQDINRILASAGTHAEELIALNEGKVINIVRWRENSQEKYKCEVDAFASSFRSCATDEEFNSFMNELPDLNDAICPSVMDEKVHKASNEAAEALSREFLRGVNNGMSGGFSGNQIGDSSVISINGQNYVNVNGQYVPIQTATSASVPMSSPAPTSNQVPTTPPMNSQLTQNPGFTQQSPINTAQNQVSTTPTTPTTPVQQTQQVPVEDTAPWSNQPVNTAQSNEASSVPTDGNGNPMPPCLGQHKDNDPKCMACLHEIPCMTTAQ